MLAFIGDLKSLTGMCFEKVCPKAAEIAAGERGWKGRWPIC